MTAGTFRRALLAFALALAAVGCRRAPHAAAPRPVPVGDAVWFADGFGRDPAETEGILARGGLPYVFLPAVRLERPNGSWTAVEQPLPALPGGSPAVVLVVSGDTDLAMTGPPGSEEAAAAPVTEAVRRILARGVGQGRIEGVHLDLPFSASTAPSLGLFAARIRASLPSPLFVTCSLRFAPDPKTSAEFLERLGAVDGFVAFVSGDGPHADPIATDALGKPWWCGYVVGARAVWTDGSGRVRGRLTERHLRAMTDEARTPMRIDLGLREEGTDGFVFQPPGAVTVAGVSIGAGDRVSFQQPLLSDLLYRLGSDLAGRRFVRGRLAVLDGVSETERVFTLAALSDVLLGKPLAPDLRVEVHAAASGIRVSAHNVSAHASAVSRTTNWVEVDVPAGRIRDVLPGGFDRYEVYDAQGQAVTPGRATRVRFYETLIAPDERIEGEILLWGKPAPGCCRAREHVLAAAGPEIAGDWSTPPPTPTPVSRPTPSRPKKKR